ncbi:MAG: phosphodiester glycosidase family protein [Oscillatoriales cyanobacterium SM2_3_0]|nr:phosphodiester glycosidase family protein [Oscillatoriales cyanobacterium SM2_3_0]
MSLFQGISYQRLPMVNPRPLMVHVIKIDLTAPGINLFVTPGEPGEDGQEIAAQTTAEFLEGYQVQVAINASFFYPIFLKTYWNYFPKTGDRVQVVGQAISDGVIYSEPQKHWYVFCVADQNVVKIYPERCPNLTVHAVSGNSLLLQGGQPVPIKNSEDGNQLFPRTAVGFDAAGKTLWFVIVDGRQQGYSEGMTLAELQNVFIDLRADTALNLDGGGSTALVIEHRRGSRTLNSPIHTRIPMRHRPIANHIGVYARPRPESILLNFY